ncbi:MAG TPA: ATP-binding protein [Candidatus Nanoarchaeia archaeon]|nr:ATP-binding protein [Candidatus Nanoarchaeia archaeon]
MYDIVIGRNEGDRKKLGLNGTVFLGKHYVKMGQTTSLSNNIYMDVSSSHVVMICGKRGSGKSYSASVIAEEMTRMPDEIKENVSGLFFDTLGVFWTMKYPNEREENLLQEWNLKPEGLKINLHTPVGYFEQAKKDGIPTDKPFSLKTSELGADDWCSVFNIKLTDPLGILVERVVESLREETKEYSILDIIKRIQEDKKSPKEVKDAIENRFTAADRWGLFDEYGTEIEELVKPGEVSVLDISVYTNISGNTEIKSLVIGLISKKLLQSRIAARKAEEVQNIEKSSSYFNDNKKQEKPLVWIFLDEAHEFLPREGKTAATDALVQLLREGRQPGVSLVLVTQQPGEIHRDVLTQSDIVISHRVTAKNDIEALNAMMQSYLIADLQSYLNNLPALPGSAIILDDNSERIYPMRIHPKRSWHGGEAPSAIKVKKEFVI